MTVLCRLSRIVIFLVLTRIKRMARDWSKEDVICCWDTKHPVLNNWPFNVCTRIRSFVYRCLNMHGQRAAKRGLSHMAHQTGVSTIVPRNLTENFLSTLICPRSVDSPVPTFERARSWNRDKLFRLMALPPSRTDIPTYILSYEARLLQCRLLHEWNRPAAWSLQSN